MKNGWRAALAFVLVFGAAACNHAVPPAQTAAQDLGKADQSPASVSADAPVSAQPAAPPAAPAAVLAAPAASAEAAVSPSSQPRVASCREPISGNETGTEERFYAMPVTEVKRAALGTLRDLDFEVQKNVRDELDGVKRRHLKNLAGSGGERVMLHFEEAQEGGQLGTLVTAQIKQNLVQRAEHKSWTETVLAQTACGLAKVASGH